MYCGQSAETLDALDGFFKTQAAATGMNETNRSSLSNNGTETRILAYEGGGHTLNIILSSKGGGETGVQVTYEDAR